MRRIVVPIGSDGVRPQRGCPPSLESASLLSSTVIDAYRKTCMRRSRAKPKLSGSAIVRENDRWRGQTAAWSCEVPGLVYFGDLRHVVQ